MEQSPVASRGERIDVVWQLDPGKLWESDWVRFTLSGLDTTEFDDARGPTGDKPVLIVARTGPRPVSQLGAEIRAALAHWPRKGLYHISDEYLSGGYGVYREFDFVIRNYWSGIFANPRIMTLPLGLTNGMTHDGRTPLASERPFLWTFSGNLSAGRVPMLREMARLEPNRSHRYDVGAGGEASGRLSKPAFKALLLDSRFVPCAMGQRISETFRVFEALEHGCIPLVERRGAFSYYDQLLPGHPIPAFRSWSDAADFVERTIADPAALDRLQAVLVAWWSAYKQRMVGEVARFARDRLAPGGPPPLRETWRPLPMPAHRLWRPVELGRHHSPEVLALKARRRLGRLLGRPR